MTADQGVILFCDHNDGDCEEYFAAAYRWTDDDDNLTGSRREAHRMEGWVFSGWFGDRCAAHAKDLPADILKQQPGWPSKETGNG